MLKYSGLILSTLMLGTLIPPSLSTCIIHGTSVKCSGNVTIEQIEAFFKNTSTKAMNAFELSSSRAEKPIFLTNVFNGVSFYVAHLSGQLEGVADDAFIDSQKTLTSLIVDNAEPFTKFNLSALATPQTIEINLTNVTLATVPPIDCNAKGANDFVYEIHDTQVKVLQTGLWKYCSSELASFVIENSVNSIEKNAFYLDSKPVTMFTIAVKSANLTTIAPNFLNTDALKDTDHVVLTLDFKGNKMTEVSEEVFKPYFNMLNIKTEIYMAGNPLACDCRFAWIVRNKAYFSKLVETADSVAKCADGRHIHELKAEDFNYCPFKME